MITGQTTLFARRHALGVLGGGILGVPLALGGCDWIPASFRFRLSVSILTPDGAAVGSGVMESRVSRHPAVGQAGLSITLRGEAVPVLLPDNSYLFAILRSDLGYPIPSLYVHNLTGDAAVVQAYRTLGSASRPRGQRNLAAPNFPKFVRFTDIQDPSTATFVDISKLGELFGPGYELDRIFVELTAEAVTARIRSILTWLPKYSDRPIDPDFKSHINRASAQLFSGNFSLGMAT